MKKKNKILKIKNSKRLSLWFYVSLLIFFAVFASQLIGIGVVAILVNSNTIEFNGLVFWLPILYLTLSSILVFIILVSIIGFWLSKNSRKFINIAKEVTMGNFSVRLKIKHLFIKELNELSSSLNMMVNELNKKETLSDDFINNFSHEFKTPISSINGFAKLLKKNDLSVTQKNEFLEIIIKESERLLALSNNVLLLSKLNHVSKINKSNDFYLDEQIRKCLMMFNSQLESKKLILNTNLKKIKISNDDVLLQQVWINLIDNAIKFSNDNGTISVNMTVTYDNVIVEINDKGIGMNQEILNHIFDKFYQGDKSHSILGNGLGLTLVKKILEVCNGKISVKSKLNCGSSFIINLPINKTSIEKLVSKDYDSLLFNQNKKMLDFKNNENELQ